MGNVVVVGSASQDYVVSVDALPVVGETRLAQGLRRFPGGKGANQAVAAARLNANVIFVGAVGEDDDGALLIREIRAEGIDASEIEITSAERTGLAFVSLLPSGESALTVVQGANAALHPARVARAVSRLCTAAEVLVVQGEIPPPVIASAVGAAAQEGARSLVNLSPYIELASSTLEVADPLVLGAFEASAFTGFAIDTEPLAERALELLLGVSRSVVITTAHTGAYWADSSGSGFISAPHVATVVDVTGSSDAFVGGLAAMLAEGLSLEAAVRVAVEVSAVAVSRVGAQASYPRRRDVRQLSA